MLHVRPNLAWINISVKDVNIFTHMQANWIHHEAGNFPEIEFYVFGGDG